MLFSTYFLYFYFINILKDNVNKINIFFFNNKKDKILNLFNYF